MEVREYIFLIPSIKLYEMEKYYNGKKNGSQFFDFRFSNSFPCSICTPLDAKKRFLSIFKNPEVKKTAPLKRLYRE